MSPSRRRPSTPRGSNGETTEREQAARLQTATYRISEAANAAEHLPELFRAIHGIISELMPARNLYIALYDAEAGLLSFPYWVDEHDPPPAAHKLERGLTEYVLRTGQPLLATPQVHEDLVRRGEADLIGAPSLGWVGVALEGPDRALGVRVGPILRQRIEITALHRDGREFPVELTVTPIRLGERWLFGAFVRDLTEEQHAEQALQKEVGEREAAERLLRQVIDADPSLVFVKDRDGKFVLVNKAVADIYGTTAEAQVGKTDADFNPNKEEVEHFLRDDRAVMDSRRPKVVAEESVTNPATGATRWFQTVKVPLLSPDGEARRVLGVATDITERKRAEEARGRSEASYRGLVQLAA